jgi:hypothetical protein
LEEAAAADVLEAAVFDLEAAADGFFEAAEALGGGFL